MRFEILKQRAKQIEVIFLICGEGIFKARHCIRHFFDVLKVSLVANGAREKKATQFAVFFLSKVYCI